MRASFLWGSSIEWALLFLPQLLALCSDLSRFQVLDSSVEDNEIRSRCLRGLQKVSARCSPFPEDSPIAQSSLSQPDVAFSTTGRVPGKVGDVQIRQKFPKRGKNPQKNYFLLG